MSILRDIGGYLQQRRHVSLNDLVLHFNTSPDAMRGMLERWVRKGKVVRCPASACEGCSSSCASAPGEAYEWIEEATEQTIVS